MNYDDELKKIFMDRRLDIAFFNDSDPDASHYTFRLYAKKGAKTMQGAMKEAKSIVSWAKNHGCAADVVRAVTFPKEECGKPYYRKNYVLLSIADPVAHVLENEIETYSSCRRYRRVG